MNLLLFPRSFALFLVLAACLTATAWAGIAAAQITPTEGENADSGVIIDAASKTVQKAQKNAAAASGSIDEINKLTEQFGQLTDPEKSPDYAQASVVAAQISEKYQAVAAQAGTAARRFGEAVETMGQVAIGGGKLEDVADQAVRGTPLPAMIDGEAKAAAEALARGDKAALAQHRARLGAYLKDKDRVTAKIHQIAGGNMNIAGGTARWQNAVASASGHMAELAAEASAKSAVFQQLAQWLKLADANKQLLPLMKSNSPDTGEAATKGLTNLSKIFENDDDDATTPDTTASDAEIDKAITEAQSKPAVTAEAGDH